MSVKSEKVSKVQKASKVTKNRMGSVAGALAKPAARRQETEDEKATPGVIGRPKRPDPARRVALSISNELADYLEEAWRYHRRPGGKLAKTQSQLVEDLLNEHRAKAKAG